MASECSEEDSGVQTECVHSGIVRISPCRPRARGRRRQKETSGGKRVKMRASEEARLRCCQLMGVTAWKDEERVRTMGERESAANGKSIGDGDGDDT